MSNLLSQAIHGVGTKTSGQAISNAKLFPLPKLIVIVADDNLLREFTDMHKGVSKAMSRIVNFIMTEYDHGVASFKENLPAKSVKSVYPHFLWIQAPSHDNFINNSQRHKFNKALEEVSKLHQNMSSLYLKKVWDPTDQSLFFQSNHKFSTAGYAAYWEAVDRTIGYCDSIVLKKTDKPKLLSQKGKDQA